MILTIVSFFLERISCIIIQERSQTLDRTNIGTLTVPRLGIGTISWVPAPEKQLFVPGDSFTSSRGSAVREQQRTARAAHELGLNFYDTAERYSVGGGEALLRDAVENNEAVIATKFTPLPWRRGVKSVVDACRASAERLGVSCIDLYQIHMPDVVQPGRAFGYVENKDKLYWEGLARCVELGLVKEVGVSNYGSRSLTECYNFLQARGIKLASNQIHLSLLARKQGNLDTLATANELGIVTLAYYPLARGLLTSSVRTKKNSALQHYIQGGTGIIGFSEKNRIQIPQGGVLPLIDALESIGFKYDRTASQVALNWIISKGAIPIVGVTNQKYLLDAAGALDWRLSSNDIAFLEQTSDSLGFEFRGTFFKRTDSKFVGYGVESWSLCD